MGESAYLVHSFSYTAASISHEPHEDNPLHALSQSISFGRFTTESLEWGKWSSFSHKKYVEEAEKYSRPGSVAQKKAFFEAHYKRIADAKKATASATNESPDQQSESTKQNTTEIGSVTSTEGSGLLSTEKNEPPGKKSVQSDAAVSEKDSAAENLFHTPVVPDDNNASDDVMVPDVDNQRKRNSSIGNEDGSVEDKVEGRISVTKNSPGWRVSVEVSPLPRTSDAAKKSSFSENPSERMEDHIYPKKDERPVRRRFSFLNCFMTKSKTQDQNATRRKGRKQGKKPKKRSLCLCFKPQALGETETQRKVKGKSRGKKL
ncbi:PREDICTED: protein WVD2-like 7 isoform X2 [Tarenaya hassleriana]|uniref:protein WVD2-like 7 isoform X2 n=1 Tax=Tarenaya hassleriana TaxID=28532 RepID=UPI00053C7CB7|nr:PREDICTED: protein WVD2-like 7 isoform X2 [Tarenaya hassleriana]